MDSSCAGRHGCQYLKAEDNFGDAPAEPVSAKISTKCISLFCIGVYHPSVSCIGWRIFFAALSPVLCLARLTQSGVNPALKGTGGDGKWAFSRPFRCTLTTFPHAGQGARRVVDDGSSNSPEPPHHSAGRSQKLRLCLVGALTHKPLRAAILGTKGYRPRSAWLQLRWAIGRPRRSPTDSGLPYCNPPQRCQQRKPALLSQTAGGTVSDARTGNSGEPTRKHARDR